MTDLIAAARSILARPQHHIMPEERIVATYILAASPQIAEPSRDAVMSAGLVFAEICAGNCIEDPCAVEPCACKNVIAAALSAAQKRIAELVALLSECADDLASDIEDRYLDMLDYPSMKRKYDLDMEIVKKVRAALAGGTAGDGEQVTQQQVARHQRRES